MKALVAQDIYKHDEKMCWQGDKTMGHSSDVINQKQLEVCDIFKHILIQPVKI